MSRVRYLSGAASVAAVAVSLLLSANIASAQSSSLFGGRGTTGASTGGGGSRGTGTSSGGSSMFNQSYFGATTQSLRGSSGQTPGQSMLNGGSAIGQGQGMSGQSSLVGNGFVGRASDTNNFVGRQGAAGQGGAGRGQNTRNNPRNARRQGQGRNNNANGNNSGFSTQQQRSAQLIAQQRVAFEHSSIPTSEVESKLAVRFDESMSKRIDAKNLSFDLDPKGVLTMRGEVRTPGQSELAELIVRMEPGVSDVRNELTVAAAEQK